MKNIIKRCSLFSAAALIALTIFAGLTCFAANNEPLPSDTGYTVNIDCDIQEANLAATDVNGKKTEIQSISKSTNSNENSSVGKNIAIGIGSGLVITLIVCICIFISYKKHGATEPYNYKENAKLVLIDSSDVLINTHVEKRKIDKD